MNHAETITTPEDLKKILIHTDVMTMAIAAKAETWECDTIQAFAGEIHDEVQAFLSNNTVIMKAITSSYEAEQAYDSIAAEAEEEDEEDIDDYINRFSCEQMVGQYGEEMASFMRGSHSLEEVKDKLAELKAKSKAGDAKEGE